MRSTTVLAFLTATALGLTIPIDKRQSDDINAALAALAENSPEDAAAAQGAVHAKRQADDVAAALAALEQNNPDDAAAAMAATSGSNVPSSTNDQSPPPASPMPAMPGMPMKRDADDFDIPEEPDTKKRDADDFEIPEEPDTKKRDADDFEIPEEPDN